MHKICILESGGAGGVSPSIWPVSSCSPQPLGECPITEFRALTVQDPHSYGLSAAETGEAPTTTAGLASHEPTFWLSSTHPVGAH